MMELFNIKSIKRRWKIIFFKNYIHIFSLIIAGFVLFDALLNMFNNNKSFLKPSMLISVITISPLLLLKVKLRIRIGEYLKIIERGTVYDAHLLLIENANIFGGANYFGGYAYKYIFHFSIKKNEKENYKKCPVVCIKINKDILSLKKKYNDYIVPKDTQIKVVEYKNKCVVLQNDCGFYDIAAGL